MSSLLLLLVLLPDMQILSGQILLRAFRLSCVSLGWRMCITSYSGATVEFPAGAVACLSKPLCSHSCCHVKFFHWGCQGLQRSKINVVLSGGTGPWMWHFSQPLLSGRQAGRWAVRRTTSEVISSPGPSLHRGSLWRNFKLEETLNAWNNLCCLTGYLTM